jgi:transposase-like protein
LTKINKKSQLKTGQKMEKAKKQFIKKNKSMVKRGKIYSEEFKLKVVEEVLTGKYSKAEASRIYGIKGKSSILEWTRQYSGEPGYDKRGKVMSSQKTDNSQQTIKEQTIKIKNEK